MGGKKADLRRTAKQMRVSALREASKVRPTSGFTTSSLGDRGRDGWAFHSLVRSSVRVNYEILPQKVVVRTK